MGNCGTREENAVVAAHAQGCLFFLSASDVVLGFLAEASFGFGGCWDLGGWTLPIASKFGIRGGIA